MHLPMLKLLARRHPPVPLVYLCKILKSEVDWVNNMCLIFFSRAFKQTGAPGEFLTL